MTLKGGTSQACAACKYQRRKCLPDCPLAPYFPADQPKKFQNAHRLFGVSNILKILKPLNQMERLQAMNSIIYESDTRESCPVYGCLAVIQGLQCQIHVAEEELHVVRSKIALCKMQQQQLVQQSQNASDQRGIGDDDSTSLLHLGMGLPTNKINNDYNNNNSNSGVMVYENIGLVLGNDPDQLMWGHNNNNSMMEFQFGDMRQEQHQHQDMIMSSSQKLTNNNLVHHFEEMEPFRDTNNDDRQLSSLDSKVACDSSSSGSEGSSDPVVAESSSDLNKAVRRFNLATVL